MRTFRRNAAVRLVAWSAVALLACDTDIWTEHRQVRVSSPELHPGETFVSGNIVLERSRLCLSLSGHRVSSDEPVEFEDASHEDLRACYEDQIRGPAELDDEGCLQLSEPGIVDWDLIRRACSVEGDFGDDRIRFDVVPVSSVRGIFDLALPIPTEILGHELVVEYPQSLIAAEGEPIFVIEDLAQSVRTQLVLGDELHTVWVTDHVAVGSASAGTPRFEDPEEPTLTLSFEARAGDVFDVSLELPAGEIAVGEVRVVSRSEIASFEVAPNVLRLADSDVFLGIGAVAIARDRDGNVLRQPPVAWSMIQGDGVLQTPDLDGDGVPLPRPHVELDFVCEGARAGEHRSATIEGTIDGFSDRATVQWQCLEDHVDGCGCTSGPKGRPAPWLLGLTIVGLARRRKPTRSPHPRL